MNLLLLRGLTRESRHWGSFPQQIESEITGLKVHCLDFPGVGTENGKESPTTIRAIRNDVRKRWLEHYSNAGTDNGRRWSIVGLSLGGMVTIDWIKEFPSDFQSAILINTSARNLSRWYQRLSLTAVKTVLASLLLKNDPKRRETAVLKMISEKHGGDQNIVNSFATIAQDRPLARKTALKQLFAASKFSAPDTVQVPVYFLASRKDKMVDWRCVRELAQHYKAPFYIHEEAGHDLALDDPNWVIEKMKQFLS
jgi:pimeloyl-[acyl-carrier protein] methyl ester esterase